MKKTVLARPNLKVFLLGAIVIVAIQHLITNGLSQSSALARPLVVSAREPNDCVDEELGSILAQADRAPASQVCTQLSDYYAARGDYRKALRYLRLSNLFAEAEEDSE